MNMIQDLKLVLEITQKWFTANIMLLNNDKTLLCSFPQTLITDLHLIHNLLIANSTTLIPLNF